MDEVLIRNALNSMLEATKEDATPIIRRLARVQVRAALDTLASAPAGDGMEDKASPRPWRIVRYGDGDSLVIHDARKDFRVCFMATPGSEPGAMERIEADAALICQAVNALARPRAAVGEQSREAIGRLIDPDAWHDTLPQDGCGPYWMGRRIKACEKADAILQSPPAKVEG